MKKISQIVLCVMLVHACTIHTDGVREVYTTKIVPTERLNQQPKPFEIQASQSAMQAKQSIIKDYTPLTQAQLRSIEQLNASGSKASLKLTQEQKKQQDNLPTGKRLVSKTGEALGIKSQGLFIPKPLDYEAGFTKEDFQALTKDQFDFSDKLITKIISNSAVLQKNQNVFGARTASFLSDTNARIQRINKLNVKTRDTIQATFKNMQGAEAKFELTGSYELSSTPLISQVSPAVKLDNYKQKIAENLIQTQIDNVFGVNALSGRSNFSLTPEIQTELVNHIKASTTMFDTNLSKIKRLQAIADMSDTIMNRLANPQDGIDTMLNQELTQDLIQQPITLFSTIINPDGSYQATITNDTGASSSTIVSNSGRVTQRIFTIPQTDERSETIFTTHVDPSTGTTTTIMENAKDGIKTLSKEEDSLIKIVHDQLQAMANVKSMIKATLWLGKQTAMNFIPLPITIVHSLCITAVAPIAIKGGSMLMGYKWSDPTVRTSINAAMELTFGNSRGWLSNNPNRVFTQGSAPARALEVIQGKGNLTGANLGSATYNSIKSLSFQPLSQALDRVSSAKIDPREEYYHTLDDILIEAGKEAWLSITSANTLVSNDIFSGKVAATTATISHIWDNSSFNSMWFSPRKIFTKI